MGFRIYSALLVTICYIGIWKEVYGCFHSKSSTIPVLRPPNPSLHPFCDPRTGANCKRIDCPDETEECSSSSNFGPIIHDELRRRVKRARGVIAGPFTFPNRDIVTGYEMGAKRGGGPREFKIVFKLREVDNNGCECTKTRTCVLKGNPHHSRRYNNNGQQRFYDNLLNVVYSQYVRQNRECPPIGREFEEPWADISFAVDYNM